jgi:hypothetical protein
VACAALALVAAVVQAGSLLRFQRFSTALDAGPPPAAGRAVEASWSFPFERSRLRVSVPVFDSDLARAARLDTSAVLGSRGWLRDAYVARLVCAETEDPVIERLSAAFRRIREARGLDDDRYLEMMVAAVQALPYGEIEREFKLPAEVLTAGSGVCTEKCVLLGALLVHEGYDTVLWVFPTQRHVALGVRSNGARFRGTPYAFIETTDDAFIGQAEPGLSSAGPVVRPPRTIALGGTRAYRAGRQVERILAELASAQRVSTHTARYMRWSVADTTYRRRYAERAKEHLVASARAAFILGRTHDRAGVYAMLAGGGIEPAGSRQLLF